MMNTALPEDELLIRLLRGELGDADRRRLEDRLSRDPDLRRQLVECARAIDGLQHVRRHVLRRRLLSLDRKSRWLRNALWLLVSGVALAFVIWLAGC